MPRFQLLTSSNLPDLDSTPPFYRHLGIILDEQLLSFPRLITTISDSGRITGSFTKEEVDYLVAILRAGRLPIQLEKTPVSDSVFHPNLAMCRFAMQVVGLSMGVMVIIWLMMVLRYGLIGIAASLASVLQILATVAAIEVVHAIATTPLIIGAMAMSLLNGVGLLLICAGCSEPNAMRPVGRSRIGAASR